MQVSQLVQLYSDLPIFLARPASEAEAVRRAAPGRRGGGSGLHTRP